MWSFIVETWNTFIFEPILNVILILIAVIPWHSFGIALIIFTLIIRFVLYPLTKKQAIQIKKQKEIQPEIQKIKKTHKGNRQMIALETMALYKEHNFNPFALLGYLLIQIPIFIALFQVVRRIAEYTTNFSSLIEEKAYGFVQSWSMVKDLINDPSLFDPSFGFGIFDLTTKAISESGFYLPALIIVIVAALSQYFVAKQSQTNMVGDNTQTLRQILKRQQAGEEVDQEDIKAANQRFVSKAMVYFLPVIIFIFSLQWHAGLPFYFFLNSIAQYFQQKKINDQNPKVEASINGQTSEAVIEKPLNAKQKKEQQQNQSKVKAKTGRKRVTATAKTVSKKTKSKEDK